MTGSRRDRVAVADGSQASVAREGATDAVSAGIAHGSDEGHLSAAEAADAALGGDRDGDGDRDASDDALAIAEGRLKRRMYDRLSDGAAEPGNGPASGAATGGAASCPQPPARGHQTHQRTPADLADAPSPAAPTRTGQPRQDAATGGRP